MTKSEYLTRLKSPAWLKFTNKCRERAVNQCQMCGKRETEIHVHHMRYRFLGTQNEWYDVIVLCAGCHHSYHSAHRVPPSKGGSREDLTTELAECLMAQNRNVGFFLNHSADLNSYWLKSPILMDGAASDVHPDIHSDIISPERKAKITVRRAAKKALRQQQHLATAEWKVKNHTLDEASIQFILKNPNCRSLPRAMMQMIGVAVTGVQPKKWRCKLNKHLRKTHPHLLKNDAKVLLPAFSVNSLFGI